MRQNVASVDVELVFNHDVFTENCNVLHSNLIERRRVEEKNDFEVLDEVLDVYPFADFTPPADYRRLNPAVRVNVRVAEDGRAFQANAVFDDHVRSDDHVWPYAAVFADLCRRILV